MYYTKTQKLQQGVRFDPDMPQTIRLEFAKSNTKGKRTTSVRVEEKSVSKVLALTLKSFFLIVMTFFARILGQQRRIARMKRVFAPSIK